MKYEFTQISLIYLISGLIATGVVLLLWKKRKARGAMYLLLSGLASSIWNLSCVFESAATTVDLKLPWALLAYLGVTTCVAFFFLFTIEYSQINRFINKKVVFLVMLIPFITMVLAITNLQHGLIWKEILIGEKNIGVYIYGWWFWLFVIYDYLLLVSALVILFNGAVKYFIVFKTQFWLLILGSSLPFIANILYVFKINPLTGLDITPISFSLTELIVAFSIFWLNFFAIMPIARKHVIDNLLDGVVVIDNMNRIVEANPVFHQISDTSNNKLVGKPLEIIFPNIFSVNGPLNEKEFHNETQILVSGEVRYYEIRYYPVNDRNNKPIGRILIMHDITIRKSAMKIAMESNQRLRNELIEKESVIYDLNACASSIKHDLKNIIENQIILTENFKNVLSKNWLKEAQIFYDKINDTSVRLLATIDDLLILSKIRKETINLEPIDMGNIIERSIKQIEFNKNLSSAFISKPDKFPKVLGDQQLIENVWRNLILYAIKFGGNPTKVSIGYSSLTNLRTKFWIQDNGNGLPTAALKKLFTDFERIENKDSYSYEFGLSLAKKIIEKIGGQLDVSSDNMPGNGCVFSFILPNS